jgi:hypothetical protein
MEIYKRKLNISQDLRQNRDIIMMNQNLSINFNEKSKDTLQVLADSISKELENCEKGLRKKAKSYHLGNSHENFHNIKEKK